MLHPMSQPMRQPMRLIRHGSGISSHESSQEPSYASSWDATHIHASHETRRSSQPVAQTRWTRHSTPSPPPRSFSVSAPCTPARLFRPAARARPTHHLGHGGGGLLRRGLRVAGRALPRHGHGSVRYWAAGQAVCWCLRPAPPCPVRPRPRRPSSGGPVQQHSGLYGRARAAASGSARAGPYSSIRVCSGGPVQQHPGHGACRRPRAASESSAALRRRRRLRRRRGGETERGRAGAGMWRDTAAAWGRCRARAGGGERKGQVGRRDGPGPIPVQERRARIGPIETGPNRTYRDGPGPGRSRGSPGEGRRAACRERSAYASLSPSHARTQSRTHAHTHTHTHTHNLIVADDREKVARPHPTQAQPPSYRSALRCACVTGGAAPRKAAWCGRAGRRTAGPGPRRVRRRVGSRWPGKERGQGRGVGGGQQGEQRARRAWGDELDRASSAQCTHKL
jgi:hypothetical protein